MKKAYTIQVLGKVQGVYFRASTKDKAEELGVFGIVKNEQDGSVLIEVEGESEPLEKFMAWCKQGPRGARVDSLIVNDSESKSYTSFQIQR
jgi:acylphosphatase